MTFKRYVCWNASEIRTIAPIDAGGIEHASVGKDAVFLATHQALSHRRRAGSTSSQAEVVDESQVLKEFQQAAEDQSDSRILIFTGAVGTGKSHAVKWLHAMSSGQSLWHQVYIEKSNTSLRRVIEKILAGMSGPMVEKLREGLRIASSANSSLEETMDRVLNELGSNIQFSDSAIASINEEKVARECLAPILQDPVLRNYFVGQSGAIRRITEVSYEVGTVAENEYDVAFRESDLPLDVQNIAEAALPTQQAIRRLGRSPSLRSIAIEVINSELAVAKTSVFLGKGVSLSEIFEEIRIELKSQGKELVIYIEDFVLLHGIDRELADVFTQHTGANRTKCPLRVAIAVTDGFLASGPFATLVSRSSVFSLDLVLDEEINGSQVRSFVARYLNAIRIGGMRLQDARLKHPEAVDDAWVPNACSDCEFSGECHASFGQSDESYGLYPFNGIAIDNLVVQISKTSFLDHGFDPRLVIRGLIHEVLTRASEEIPDAAFPSEHVAASIDQERSAIPIDMRVRLKKDAMGQRRLSLLAFWAQRPITKIVNLNPGLHIAFDLPESTDAEYAESNPVEVEAAKGHPTRQTASEATVAELAEWANGKAVLKSATSRDARQYIYDSLVNAVRDGAYGARVVHSNVGKRRGKVGVLPIDENCIEIESSQGGGNSRTLKRPFQIIIERSDESAVLIESALLASQQGTWDGQSIERYARFRAFIDREAQRLVGVANGMVATSPLSTWMTALCLTGQPIASGKKSREEILEAALRPGVESGERTSQWNTFVSAVQEMRTKAQEQIVDRLSTSKGAGRPSVLDIAQIIDILGRYRVVEDMSSMAKMQDDDFRSYWFNLQSSSERALASETKRLDATLLDIGELLDGASDWEALSKSGSLFIKDARASGFLSSATAGDEFEQMLAGIPSDALATYDSLQQRIQANTLTVWDLDDDRQPMLERLKAFLQLLEHEVVFATDAAQTQLGIDSASVGPGDLSAHYEELANTLRFLTGEGERSDAS